ncbi:hypothetical protein CHUAL_004835 [Chamberlinius hualienensis]
MGEQIDLSWPCHSKMLTDGLWNFLKENYKTDFQMSTCDNITCHAHQLILAIFCPSLVKENQNAGLNLMPDCDFIQEDLQAIVEFVYLGKVRVAETRLDRILAGAVSLGLDSLIEVINEVKSQRNNNNKIISRKSKHLKCGKNSNKNHNYNEVNNSKEKQTDEISEENKSQMDTCEKVEPLNEFEGVCTRGKYKTAGGACVLNGDQSIDSSVIRDQHVCAFCDKRFVSRDRYIRHMRCHQNPEHLQQCPRCDYKTGEKYILIQHMASRHRLDPDGNPLARDLKCPHCDFKCVSNFQLRNHAFHKHSTKSFKCAECDYSCVKKADHDKHVRAKHRNLRPYLCEQCGNDAICDKVTAEWRDMKNNQGTKEAVDTLQRVNNFEPNEPAENCHTNELQSFLV